MTREFLIGASAVTLAAAGVTAATLAPQQQNPRPAASLLCEEPITVQVGSVTVGPTPEICIPFIQWPPAANA